jgi:release factor glutamine methyltransferase
VSELTLLRAWKSAQARLEAAGAETPSFDARLLLEEAAGVNRLAILSDPHRVIGEAVAAVFEGYIARREAREPVAHILGRKGFWKLDLKVSRDVLTPRPDTEAVILAVQQRVPEDATGRVLDLGVGSGAILLSVLMERLGFTGLGIDLSPEAAAIARENIAELGLEDRAKIEVQDYADVEGVWDLVVSNPPYIRTVDIETLEPEVRVHEPHLALDGGADGYDAYNIIIPRLNALLAPGGVFALEVGIGQWSTVAKMVRAQSLMVDPPVKDISGIDRVVAGRRPG